MELQNENIQSLYWLVEIFSSRLPTLCSQRPGWRCCQWSIAVLGWATILHYFDDFFEVLSPQADHARYGQDFDELCRNLGFTLNTKESTTGMTAEFLGIELDSIAMKARLPPAKINLIINLITMG